MDYVLPANVENLEMTGGYYPEGHHATGNGLNNLIRIDRWWDGDYTIDGMGGNDVLYGSPAGSDTINGGAGNDTLYGKEAGGRRRRLLP